MSAVTSSTSTLSPRSDPTCRYQSRSESKLVIEKQWSSASLKIVPSMTICPSSSQMAP